MIKDPLDSSPGIASPSAPKAPSLPKVADFSVTKGLVRGMSRRFSGTHVRLGPPRGRSTPGKLSSVKGPRKY